MRQQALEAQQQQALKEPLAAWHGQRKQRDRMYKEHVDSMRGASPEQQLHAFEKLQQRWFGQLQQVFIERQAAKDAKQFMKQMKEEEAHLQMQQQKQAAQDARHIKKQQEQDANCHFKPKQQQAGGLFKACFGAGKNAKTAASPAQCTAAGSSNKMAIGNQKLDN